MGNENYINPFTLGMLHEEVRELVMCQSVFHTEDYKKWAADKPPQFNAFAYLKMLEEREHATRLEF